MAADSSKGEEGRVSMKGMLDIELYTELLETAIMTHWRQVVTEDHRYFRCAFCDARSILGFPLKHDLDCIVEQIREQRKAESSK